MVDQLDIPKERLGESAGRVLSRSIEEARRRDHAVLTSEHVCVAFAQVEWTTFVDVLRDLRIDAHDMLRALEEHLRQMPATAGAPAGRCRSATRRSRSSSRKATASRTGRAS